MNTQTTATTTPFIFVGGTDGPAPILAVCAFDPNQPRDEDGRWVEWGDKGADFVHPTTKSKERLSDSLDSMRAERIIRDVLKRRGIQPDIPDYDRWHPYKAKVAKEVADEIRALIKEPRPPPPKPVRTEQIWDEDNPHGRWTDQYGRRM
jgi:hypothetical protein